MAKSKGKRAKRSSDTSGMKIAASLLPVIDDDDVDDDEENEDKDPTGSASENEEGSDDERKHNKLLEAISSLGRRKRKKLAERSEATIQMSEFTVNAEGEGDKVNLSDLIGTVDKTPIVSIKTKKQLKNLQHGQGTIKCPLSKQETERIQRQLAFQKTATEVSRWQSVVTKNQKAEQLIFPLNQEPSGPKTIVKVVAGWKAQTPLEQEIFSLLNANKQPTHDVVLTPVEEASMRAMSLEEAKLRRAELQKARALQSYYEAKAKRQKRIKSKKYHKVQNKAKRKGFLKEFDEIVKTDPAAALEELNKIELTRMQERMSLKHQNSGKWAKSKAIMAKYDEGARKAMQQQLEVNKELTQKLVNPLNAEEEEEEEDAEMLPDFVNDAEPVLDPTNPWMRGKLSAQQDPEKGENNAVESVAAEPGMVSDSKEQEEEEEQEAEEEVLLREFETKRKLRQAEELDVMPICLSDGEDPEQGENNAVESVAAEPGMVSDSKEEEEKQEPEEEVLLPEKILHQAESSDTAPVCLSDSKDVQVLTFMEEEEEEEQQEPEEHEEEVPLRTFEIAQESCQTEELDTTPICVNDSKVTTKRVAPPPVPQKAASKRKRNLGIDVTKVLTKEAKVINVPLAPTAVEDIEDPSSQKKEEQRNIIKEAFASDDVVTDFLKDKKKQEEAGRPKVVDLTLPGWGEWGGMGLKPSRNKRRRFRIKAAPAPPRKDGKLPAVIISEKRNSSVSLHQVSSIPHPFTNTKQFEATIRCPIGSTWNTQQTVKKMTAPKIVTRLGAIIEPITKEELIKDKK